MSHGKPTHVDVLVIGAGPTGGMCAQGLARAGVSVRVIDQKPAPVARGQADALQPRAMEVLASYGLSDRFLKEGNRINTTCIYHPGEDGGIKRTSHLPNITAPGGPYPYNTSIHQGVVEAVLIGSLKTAGAEVERPFKPINMTVQASNIGDLDCYPITVDIQSCDPDASPDNVETIHAKYLVGADGAHSWVRKTLGVPFPGDRTNRRWGALDLVPETTFPDIRNTCQVHSHSGFCLLVPRENDMIRLYIPLEDHQTTDTARGNIDWGNPDELLKRANRAFHPYQIAAPHGYVWWTSYVVGQRVADAFSVDHRVFLAGDACHTHSPKAGQGMNAGISDAHNLIWKLTYAVRGWASGSLLSTYEDERRKFAKDLIKFDKEYVALIEQFAVPSAGFPKKYLEPEPIDHSLHEKAIKEYGLFKSGVGVQYADSVIVINKNPSLAKNLVIGRRLAPEVVIRAADDRAFTLHDLLLVDMRFKIVVFVGDLTNGAQYALAHNFGEMLSAPAFSARLATNEHVNQMLDIYTVVLGKRGDLRFTDVPLTLRPHWSKVFVDDVDISGTQGGKTYENLGISSAGAAVIVRPDGFVGAVIPLDENRDFDNYFDSWLKP